LAFWSLRSLRPVRCPVVAVRRRAASAVTECVRPEHVQPIAERLARRQKQRVAINPADAACLDALVRNALVVIALKAIAIPAAVKVC
jgi:hypothetical protein